MLRYAIGIDVGGTNIKGGLVREDGKLIDYDFLPTESKRGAERVLENIILLLERIFNRVKTESINVHGIGVVTPGVIDTKLGGVKGGAYNIPGWIGMPFMKIIAERFKRPVFAHNDVTGTVLAEFKYGAGRGKSNIVLAAFGTGIGGGIVIDGKLYSGATGYAGEIGHVVIHKGGYRCTCGTEGCWEEYASIRGILRTARSIIKDSRGRYSDSPLIGDTKNLTPEIIFNEAREGDELAGIIVDRICEDTAIGIGSLINIFNPDIFIVGGGISRAGKIYLDGIASHVEKYTLPDSLEAVEIKLAELGYEAALIGAASLVFEGINRYSGS